MQKAKRSPVEGREDVDYPGMIMEASSRNRGLGGGGQGSIQLRALQSDVSCPPHCGYSLQAVCHSQNMWALEDSSHGEALIRNLQLSRLSGTFSGH